MKTTSRIAMLLLLSAGGGLFLSSVILLTTLLLPVVGGAKLVRALLHLRRGTDIWSEEDGWLNDTLSFWQEDEGGSSLVPDRTTGANT